MRRYLLRRLFAIPLLLLGVLTLTFLLVHAAPGEPFTADPSAGADPEAAIRMRAVFGTDAPLHVQYARWISAAARLDFGVSYTHRRPVLSILAAAVPPTLLLMGSALLLALVAGGAAACGAAVARRPVLDRILDLAAMTVYAAPSFWVGVLLVQAMAVGLGWLPASGRRSIDAEGMGTAASLVDAGRHLFLPCLTLALPAAAGIFLYLRAGLEEHLAAPPARSGLARGASRLRVVVLLLRNAAAPVVAWAGHALPALVGGSLVVEVLFAWPGMGRVAWEAILARDLPVILAAVTLSTIVAAAGTLAADLACAAADPRVSLGRGRSGGAAAGAAVER